MNPLKNQIIRKLVLNLPELLLFYNDVFSFIELLRTYLVICMQLIGPCIGMDQINYFQEEKGQN